MSSLFSIGTSGLNAAQLGLKVTGNNIANAGTDGYSRQSAVQVDRVSQNVGRYTLGSGVDVVAVQRAYSQYLTQSVWNANGSLQGATTTNDLATALNGLLKNSGSLQATLDGFYGGFNAVANAPRDPSARQALLGNAQTVVMAFNTFGQQLDQQRAQINTRIGGAVDTINSLSRQIADLNTRISQVRSTQPNDLLDQRDGLIKQLSGELGVTATPQPDGTVSVYSSAGQVLVSGQYAFELKVGTDAADASRTVVQDLNGNDISGRISGGTLGALLDYRNNTLDPAQNQLGRAALALAQTVNEQQAKGLDMNGNQGEPLFIVPYPSVAAVRGNGGTATVQASIGDLGKLTNDNYQLTYTGSGTAPSVNGWALTTSQGRSVALTDNGDGTLSAEGLTISPGAGAQVGDSFQIRPSRDVASQLSLATSDPHAIAAAGALAGSAAAGNTGGASVAGVDVADSANAGLFNGATVSFGAGGSYTVTDGTTTVTGTYAAGTPIQFNGWSLELSGTPAAGDSFSVGKNGGGLNDNRNALDLAGLADRRVLDGGNASAMEAYAGLTRQIGLAGSNAANDLATETGLYNQAMGAQQSANGVNLDEEAANLIKFQQAYQASAQVISTAQTLFTSLIGAIRG